MFATKPLGFFWKGGIGGGKRRTAFERQDLAMKLARRWDKFIDRIEQVMIFHPSVADKVPDRVHLFKFDEPNSVKNWTVLTDQVNGGFSTATFEWKDGAGELSMKLPENSAIQKTGFAAIRSPNFDEEGIDLSTLEDVESYDAVQLKDGRLYTCNLRVTSDNLAELYQYPFSVPQSQEWQTVRLHFRDFYHTLQGKVDRSNEFNALSLERIIELQILVAEKREGPFRLEIDEIDFINLLEAKRKTRFSLDIARHYDRDN